MNSEMEWTGFASNLEGAKFACFQRELSRFDGRRLAPSLPCSSWSEDLQTHNLVTQAETVFIEAMRKKITPLVSDIPSEVDAFIAWFERLRETGPGQGDPLFRWLETTASQMKWFIEQEVAGEAGFDDLVALTQVKMPTRAKLEMAPGNSNFLNFA